LVHSDRITQFEFGVATAYELRKTAQFQFTPDRAAHQAAMTGDVNARMLFIVTERY